MFNKLKANPGMAFGAALFVIALIAVIVWIVRRGDNDKNEEVNGRPEIEILNINKNIIPIEEKTESYKMYEEYTMLDLSKNINFELVWNNKGGVESISKLIFKRSAADGTEVYTKIISKDDSGGNGSYFVPFSKNNTFTFRGTDIDITQTNINLVGPNRLQIFYVLKDQSSEQSLFDSDVSFTGENKIEIKAEDLNIVKISGEKQTVTYTPTTTGISILKDSQMKKEYYMYPGGKEYDIHTSINGVNGPITLVPATDTSTGSTYGTYFYIYFPEAKIYLGRQSLKINDYTFKAVPSMLGAAERFILTNSPSHDDKYRLQNLTGEFLGMTDDGTTVFININNENVTEELYNSINIEIRETLKMGACGYHYVQTGCDASTNTKTYKLNITSRTPACAYIPSAPSSVPCDKDATCEFTWSPCPVVCNGAATNAHKTVTETKVITPATGNGKTCKAQEPPPEPCGRKLCQVGRSCLARPEGGKIVRENVCIGIHGNNCSFNSADWECEGTSYLKTCAAGKSHGDPDCELQQSYDYYDGYDNVTMTWQQLLDGIPRAA